jgi:radical SAM superfamily enzyme with C-terminal helix-hairpin-helix motif
MLPDGLDIARRACIENIAEMEAKEPCPNLVACSVCGKPLRQRPESTRRSTVGNIRTTGKDQ